MYAVACGTKSSCLCLHAAAADCVVISVPSGPNRFTSESNFESKRKQKQPLQKKKMLDKYESSAAARCLNVGVQCVGGKTTFNHLTAHAADTE